MLNDLSDLFTDECRSRREGFNRWVRSQVDVRALRSPSDAVYADTLRTLAQDDLLVPPAAVLERMQFPIAVIACVLQYRGPDGAQTIALVEHDESGSSRPTGVGKSSLAFAVLGIRIPYDEIPRPRSRDCPEDVARAVAALAERTPTALDASNLVFSLVSSDMPILGLGDDMLMEVAVPAGEPIIATWDLSRSISRRFDAHYYDLRGGTRPWLRAYVEALADTYFLSAGAMFADMTRRYPLNCVVILRKRGPSASAPAPTLIDYSSKAGREKLYDQLMRNPLYRAETTPFWRVNTPEHRRRAIELMSRARALPKVYRLDVGADASLNATYGLELLRRIIAEQVNVPRRPSRGARVIQVIPASSLKSRKPSAKNLDTRVFKTSA